MATPTIAKMKQMPETRGSLEWDMARCDQCQDCERVCPTMAIKVYPEEKRVEYQPFRCLFCLLCKDNCMQQAITNTKVVAVPGYEKRVEKFETKQ